MWASDGETPPYIHSQGARGTAETSPPGGRRGAGPGVWAGPGGAGPRRRGARGALVPRRHLPGPALLGPAQQQKGRLLGITPQGSRTWGPIAVRPSATGCDAASCLSGACPPPQRRRTAARGEGGLGVMGTRASRQGWVLESPLPTCGQDGRGLGRRVGEGQGTREGGWGAGRRAHAGVPSWRLPGVLQAPAPGLGTYCGHLCAAATVRKHSHSNMPRAPLYENMGFGHLH